MSKHKSTPEKTAKKTQDSGEKQGKRGLKALYRNPHWMGIVLFLGADLAIALICLLIIAPTRYSLQVGDIAKTTITASKDVVDEVSTRQRREAAASLVQPDYHHDESVSQQILAQFEAIFEDLGKVKAYAQDIDSKRPANQSTQGEDRISGLSYSQPELQAAALLMQNAALSQYQINTLMLMSSQELELVHENLLSALKTTLNGAVAEGKVDAAINGIQQTVGGTMRSEVWWNVSYPVLRACLKPNMVVNEEATAAKQEKARSDVEPVVFKQGQNIVVAGEKVTAPQLAMLGSLGLLEGNRYDTELYFGIALLSTLIMVLMVGYITAFCRALLRDTLRQVLLVAIGLLTLVICALTSMVDAFLLPVALGVLLTAVLLGAKAAMGMNLVLALLMGAFSLRTNSALSAQAAAMIFVSLLGGTTGILSARWRVQRSAMLITGLVVGAANLLAALAIGLLTNNDFTSVLTHGAYALAGGILSAILCVGIQPALEVLFNLVTPAKLLELSNPNHPLLRRLMLEAPGTYHHSMIVANIAEGAAEAIGANPLLVRVGAYFHDIGKLKRPLYFKENQMGENPHDTTDPRVSTAILVAHTREGVQLGQRFRLPQAILDMVAQHHGDTPVLFFYNKAVQLYGGQPVDIADFRYEGPKPQTAEAAILMLADTVEAAIRALSAPTPDKVSQTIKRLIKGKVEDGQLDESPLTFRDISRISQAFETVLSGVFHERIEYPAIEIHPVEELPKEVKDYMKDQQLQAGGQQGNTQVSEEGHAH